LLTGFHLAFFVTTSISSSSTPYCLPHFIPLLDSTLLSTDHSTFLATTEQQPNHNVHSSSILGSSCGRRCCSSGLGYSHHHILAYRCFVEWHGYPGPPSSCSNVAWTLDGQHNNEFRGGHPLVQDHLRGLMGTRRAFPRRRIRRFLLRTVHVLSLLTTIQMPCKNSTLGWNFKEDTYKGMGEFTLQLEYTYTDDSYAYSSASSDR